MRTGVSEKVRGQGASGPADGSPALSSEPGGVGNRGMKRAKNSLDLARILVGMARPEKTLQSITLTPGDDVRVKMRNALADAIIDGYKNALGLHAAHYGIGEKAHVGEKRAEERIGQVHQGLEVRFDDEQAMAGKQGAVIEEGEGDFVFEDFVAGDGAANDLAERAVIDEHGDELCRTLWLHRECGGA